jgi:hypothetical protein
MFMHIGGMSDEAKVADAVGSAARNKKPVPKPTIPRIVKGDVSVIDVADSGLRSCSGLSRRRSIVILGWA